MYIVVVLLNADCTFKWWFLIKVFIKKTIFLLFSGHEDTLNNDFKDFPGFQIKTWKPAQTNEDQEASYETTIITVIVIISN